MRHPFSALYYLAANKMRLPAHSNVANGQCRPPRTPVLLWQCRGTGKNMENPAVQRKKRSGRIENTVSGPIRRCEQLLSQMPPRGSKVGGVTMRLAQLGMGVLRRRRPAGGHPAKSAYSNRTSERALLDLEAESPNGSGSSARNLGRARR